MTSLVGSLYYDAPQVEDNYHPFLDTQVSPAPPCQSVRKLLLLSDIFETAGVKRNSITHDDLSCCSELPESKDGNASGVHEGLNARAMYMKA